MDNIKQILENLEIVCNVVFLVSKNDAKRYINSGLIKDNSTIDSAVGNLDEEQLDCVANIYNGKDIINLTYEQCRLLYLEIVEDYKKNIFIQKCQKHYDIIIEKDELLIEVVKKIKIKNENKNWHQENIFIEKSLNHKLDLFKIEYAKRVEAHKKNKDKTTKIQKEGNVIFFPKKIIEKKDIDSDIIEQIMKYLEISKEDAIKIFLDKEFSIEKIKFKPPLIRNGAYVQ